MPKFIKILLFAAIIATVSTAVSLQLAKAQTTWPSGPWWYTNHPEIVGVSSTGAMTANGVGQAVVCVQPSISIVKPTQCFLVNVVQIVK